MQRTLIIAEIGECFNGSLAAAKKLIAAAKAAGCDIAKFQTLDYENIAYDDPEADWFRKIALNPKKISYLIGCAQDADIGILFTPENRKTAQWLLDAGLRDVKIASSCVNDAELIAFIDKRFKRVYMSTGMSSLDEVRKAIHGLRHVRELYILHCVSEYPTGPLLEERGLQPLLPGNVKLNMMRMLIDLFPKYVIGYSDHTSGILAPIAAVAAGARVIEKHITLDRETPLANYRSGKRYLGTDHVLSIEPPELREMVRQIRLVEEMFGANKWERSEGEKILKRFLRNRFKDVK